MRLYQAGDWGYAQFRIPCLLATSAGALLALCEARSNPRSDSGQICILLRMSLDGGQSWSQPRIVAEDAGNTVGNPCLVEHLPSGTLQLIFNGNDGAVSEADILAGRGCRRVLRMESSDGGQSWKGPWDITDQVTR
ncbi:MAG: exo-alpha-sialidase, partial [Christensenellaceae bacterium]